MVTFVLPCQSALLKIFVISKFVFFKIRIISARYLILPKRMAFIRRALLNMEMGSVLILNAFGCRFLRVFSQTESVVTNPSLLKIKPRCVIVSSSVIIGIERSFVLKLG